MRDRQIDSVVIVLLERIVFFQDRLHRENPIKVSSAGKPSPTSLSAPLNYWTVVQVKCSPFTCFLSHSLIPSLFLG